MCQFDKFNGRRQATALIDVQRSMFDVHLLGYRMSDCETRLKRGAKGHSGLNRLNQFYALRSFHETDRHFAN
jgi:hypothetical protein